MRQLWSDTAGVWSDWNSAKGTGRSDVCEQLLRSEPIKQMKRLQQMETLFLDLSQLGI